MPKFVIDEGIPRSIATILKPRVDLMFGILGAMGFRERRMKRFMSLRKENRQ